MCGDRGVLTQARDRPTHTGRVEQLLTGLGLSTAAGLNAYIPMLMLGLLGRFTDVVNLPQGWTWLENGWVLLIVAVLLDRRDRRRQDSGAGLHQRLRTDLRAAGRRRHRVRFGHRGPDRGGHRPRRMGQVGRLDSGGDRCRRRPGGVADQNRGAPGGQRRPPREWRRRCSPRSRTSPVSGWCSSRC